VKGDAGDGGWARRSCVELAGMVHPHGRSISVGHHLPNTVAPVESSVVRAATPIKSKQDEPSGRQIGRSSTPTSTESAEDPRDELADRRAAIILPQTIVLLRIIPVCRVDGPRMRQG
jgi:hypothetical protein